MTEPHLKSESYQPRDDSDRQGAPPPSDEPATVEYVLPQKGGIARTSTQPGSVLSFESVDLYAGVPGYLRQQSVDIGDRVRQGQILAVVDVPDLEKQVQHNAAVVEQVRSHVAQMKAKLASAQADAEAARAAVPHAEALLRSKSAELLYRRQQLDRMKELASSRSIEDKLVDEYTSHRDAVREAEVAAEEAVNSAKANVKAVEAKVVAAEARQVATNTAPVSSPAAPRIFGLTNMM